MFPGSPLPVNAGGGLELAGGHPGERGGASKVFVGGLDLTVNSEELAHHFSLYGTITDAVAIKQRGFGFVEFLEPEAAQAVLDAGPHQVRGKEVTVKLAETRERMAEAKSEAAMAALAMSAGPTSLPNKIFVGGLPRTTDTTQLADYFSQYGALSDAVVMPARGFGFVAFHDAAAMEAAMAEADRHTIEGQPITVKVADGKRPLSGPSPVVVRHPVPNGNMYGPPIGAGGKGPPCHGGGGGGKPGGVRKIFVGGIPKDLLTKELEAYFAWYGRLVDCVVMQGRGFGFVEFDDEAAVDRVMRDANIHVIRDHKISLRIADGKGKGAGGGGLPPPASLPLGPAVGQGHVHWGPPPTAVPPWGRAPGPPQQCGYPGGIPPWAAPPAGKGLPPLGKGPPPPWATPAPDPGKGYWPPPGKPGPDAYGGYGPAAGSAGAKLFIRGLPDTFGDEELRRYFEFYGAINDSKVMTGRGFGFVTFADPRAADGALRDRHEFDGIRLTVKLADGLKGPSKGAAPY